MVAVVNLQAVQVCAGCAAGAASTLGRPRSIPRDQVHEIWARAYERIRRSGGYRPSDAAMTAAIEDELGYFVSLETIRRARRAHGL